jgi:hypothetical protein
MFTEACGTSTGTGTLVRRSLLFPAQLCEGHVYKKPSDNPPKIKRQASTFNLTVTLVLNLPLCVIITSECHLPNLL